MVNDEAELPEHVRRNRVHWDARRGARMVGIDNSAAQLATARRLQREHGLAFTLIHGNAEQVPYPDATFDLAISK